MAHNVMRLDSTNDRYVTETMIDLNLDLNEEIDFDFFDNAETPSKDPLSQEHDGVNTSQSRPCSPQSLNEDDDDVQTSPHLLGHDLEASKLLAGGTVKGVNSSLDSIDEPLSTGTENEEKDYDEFDECETSKTTEDTNTRTSDNMPIDEVVTSQSVMKVGSEPSFSQKTSCEETLYSRLNDSQENDKSFKSQGNSFESDRLNKDEKKDSLSGQSNFNQRSVKSSENLNEDTWISKRNVSPSSKSSETHDGDTSSKSSKSQKAEGYGNGYDSDEGCPFEGSDSDELLLGVHTLTIIPRENDDSIPPRSVICEEANTSKEPEMIHTMSCEKAAITARSSSGYSSASCKAHGCMVSRGHTSKADSRQSSQMKVHTPDMDEFIKSFRKIQPSPAVSFTSTEKYSALKKCRRRNMSFSNEELQRIERENAILLNKIVLQQRARPSVVHKYERRVTSNAINRARQLKKIEYDNEVLLKKIQDVKRKSTLSAQNSRCISQASTSQF